MKVISYLFALVLIVLGVSFACLNTELVTINYSVGMATMHLSLLLVITFAVGGMFGVIVSMVLFVRLKLNHYKLQHKVKSLEKEVENLRAIPIKND